MTFFGYLESPWPGEDRGPERLQVARQGTDLALREGESLACTTRNTLMSTVAVLGAPGEVYLLTHSSANRHLQAWRISPGSNAFEPLWHKAAFGCASYMVLYPDTGELLVNDYRHHGEEVVVLAIESGIQIARVRSGGLTQSVVFPNVGWGRDFYWSSMGCLARVYVQ